MKKIILILFASAFLSSCLNDDEPKFQLEYLPIDEAITPQSFEMGIVDTIKLKYTLPNSCYFFNDLHYEYQDTIRVVAIIGAKQLDVNCAEVITQKEFKFTVMPNQTEDYVFKFYKGRDSNNESIFDEVVIPVN